MKPLFRAYPPPPIQNSPTAHVNQNYSTTSPVSQDYSTPAITFDEVPEPSAQTSIKSVSSKDISTTSINKAGAPSKLSEADWPNVESLLASGVKKTEIARQLNVSRKTLHRFLADRSCSKVAQGLECTGRELEKLCPDDIRIRAEGYVYVLYEARIIPNRA